MFVFVINYCCDTLRPQLLATFGELAISPMVTEYVAVYGGEIISDKENIVRGVSKKLCM
jgi:hypothetical protein